MKSIKYVVTTTREKFEVEISTSENIEIAKSNIKFNINNMGDHVISIEPIL